MGSVVSLLRQIQEAATSSDVPVTDLLRKCKILAARLGSKEFGDWVDRELNGYKEQSELPDYRVMLVVESLGNFSGPGGSSMSNASIPSGTIPEKYHDFVETEYLMFGIGMYQDLLRNSDDGTFRSPWPSNLVAIVGRNIYRYMNCMSAWKVIPRGILVGILEAVRNRILNFALDIEKENPEAGEAPIGSTPIPAPTVHKVFNTNFYGSVGNVATGSDDFEQRAIEPVS